MNDEDNRPTFEEMRQEVSFENWAAVERQNDYNEKEYD